jgi:hypothetical protein
VTRLTQVPLGSPAQCRLRDCHPLWCGFPTASTIDWFCNSTMRGPTTPTRKTSLVWARPLSLAATDGIDFSFFSTGYLDVSVGLVCHLHLLIQCKLIRESRDQHSFDSFPGLFAAFHALHRLMTPRHPPCALSSLTTNIQDSPVTRSPSPRKIKYPLDTHSRRTANSQLSNLSTSATRSTQH